MEVKRNVHLIIELLLTVTGTLKDLWLVLMNTFLLGYTENKGYIESVIFADLVAFVL